MKTTRMGRLGPGQSGRFFSVSGLDQAMTQRLLEMGLLEGSVVELMHEAPFGKDPVAVRVRGALIALRRNEADAVEVSLSGEASRARGAVS